MLHIVCCVLHAVHLLAHAPEQAVSARTHAHAQRARADALVGVAVADEALGRTPLVICAFTLHWPQLPRHSSCTASIAAEQCGLAATAHHGHRHREGAAGGRDGGTPGRLVHRAAASLQGTPQRRRGALLACMSHRACCALPANICSQLPRLTLCSVLRCLFVCLFICLLVYLFVCLFATGLCKTHRRWRGLRLTRVTLVVMAYSRLAAQECVAVRALVRRRQPRQAAAAQAHCTSAYA